MGVLHPKLPWIRPPRLSPHDIQAFMRRLLDRLATFSRDLPLIKRQKAYIRTILGHKQHLAVPRFHDNTMTRC
jgi:hypothetical protein